METLEKSRVCRLCGKQSNISIDIFDKKENHVRKINAILPILVHEMDFLPKQMCHRCSYKLEEFYKFYDECAKTDSHFKSQLSWMRKETSEEQITTPMVKMNPFKIKTEPPDCDDSDSSDVFGHISSFGAFSSPILTCSRCKCLCNTTVKVSRSPVEGKTFSKVMESNHTNSSEDDSKGNNARDKKVDLEVVKEDKLKEKTNPSVIKLDIPQDSNDGTNRALRPRKGSVNYIGPSKKGAHKLRKKFKNKEGIFDSEIVDPVKLVVTSNNLLNPSPIIKLEKVDDTLKNLRKRKNLEEFNKRVKMYGHEKRLHRDQDLNNKILQRLENRSKRSFQKEEGQEKKAVHKDEKMKRKSLQAEGFQAIKTLTDENTVSLQNRERHVKKIVSADENQSLQRQDDQSVKVQCPDILIENAGDLKQTLNNDCNKNIPQTEEVHIKQEDCCILEEQLDQSKQSSDAVKNQKVPMCPVVKLEKDYTCNVDYPRVKIKRHLVVTDPGKSNNGALSDPVEDVSQNKTDKVKKSKSDKASQSKSLRRKEKRLKGTDGVEKAGKVSKKKRKKLELGNVKKVVAEKGTSAATELKIYCEGCSKCFGNRELFKLHPCYQN